MLLSWPSTQPQLLRRVARHRGRLQAPAAKPDVAVGPHQVERGLGNRSGAPVRRRWPRRPESRARAAAWQGPAAARPARPARTRPGGSACRRAARTHPRPARRRRSAAAATESGRRPAAPRPAGRPARSTAALRGNGCRSATRCGTPAAARARAPSRRRRCGPARACAAGRRTAAVGNHQPEAAVGRLQQALRDRQALVLVGVEQRVAGLALDHQRELPRQVVGILQAGVHALRADRAVDVRRVAEQEAAAIAKARRAAMVDAVGGEPGAGLERQAGAGLAQQRGNHVLEAHVLLVAQLRRQDADDAPVVLCRASGRAGGSRSCHRYTLTSSATMLPVTSTSATKNTCS